jgi:hypothetical protein
VLQSYEIVKRQILYLDRFFPDNAELILVDDGSDPPIMKFLTNRLNDINVMWLKFFCTHDASSWSEHMATNLGIREAAGEYILKTDIDHIITREVLDIAMRFDNKNLMMFFNRKEGKLDEGGNLVDLGTERTVHGNTFILKRDWFLKVGGYNEYGEGYDTGGSYDLMKRLQQFGVGICVSNKYVYVWPNSPVTPTEDQHLFHNLRKTL